MKKSYYKYFVLDTNILLDNIANIEVISEKGNNLIIIPATVLSEIDKFKTGFNETNFQARNFARLLQDAKIKKSYSFDTSDDNKLSMIFTFVDNIDILIVDKKEYEADKIQTDRSIRNDSKIIEIADNLRHSEEYGDLIFLSLDIMARTRALGKGINSESLDLGYNELDIERDFHKEIGVTDDLVDLEEHISSIRITKENGNSDFLFKTKQNTWETVDDKNIHRLSMPPMNFRQKIMVELILDENDIIVSSGPAGTGKTSLAISAAMRLMDLHKNKYTNIAYIRRTVISGTADDELGFLPGDLSEKMGVYNQPMIDSIKKIASLKKKNQKKEELEERIEKITEQYSINYLYAGHLRGSTLDEGTILIIDECQNFDLPSIRTIISRAGKDNIIIAVGSNNQIDTKFLTKNNNALTFLINKCGTTNEEGVNIKGIKLTNVMRSKISEWADNELVQV